MLCQLEIIQIYIGRRPVGWWRSDQAAERIPGDTQLLLQRRQERAVVVGLALRAEHVHLGHRTSLARGADEGKHVLIVSHDALGHPDLRAQRGDPQRLDHYIATDAERDGLK